jgi:hypothetical protein
LDGGLKAKVSPARRRIHRRDACATSFAIGFVQDVVDLTVAAWVAAAPLISGLPRALRGER